MTDIVYEQHCDLLLETSAQLNDPVLETAILAAREAGHIARLILSHDHNSLAFKDADSTDPVTLADKLAQAAIETMLMARFPGSGFVGEETSQPLADVIGEAIAFFDDPEMTAALHNIQQGVGEHVRRLSAQAEAHGGELPAGQWSVDPIDGTRNFSRGDRNFGISIDYTTEEGLSLASVIHAPLLYSTWYGNDAVGAHKILALNPPSHLHLSATQNPNLLIDVGLSTNDGSEAPYRRFADDILGTHFRARNPGAAVISLASVAEGGRDGCILINNKVWDYAAGLNLARLSGAAVKMVRAVIDSKPHKILVIGRTPEILAMLEQQLSDSLCPDEPCLGVA